MATSKLQRYTGERLKFHLHGVTIIEGSKPDWLISSQGERLELDFLMPSINIAVEVQGEQHYKFVRHFHQDMAGFADQLRRDSEKRVICNKAGIRLMEVMSEMDADLVAKEMLSLLPRDEPDEDFISNMKEFNDTFSFLIRKDKSEIKAVPCTDIDLGNLPEMSTKRMKVLKRKIGVMRRLDEKLEVLKVEVKRDVHPKEVHDFMVRKIENIKKHRPTAIKSCKKYAARWAKG